MGTGNGRALIAGRRSENVLGKSNVEPSYKVHNEPNAIMDGGAKYLPIISPCNCCSAIRGPTELTGGSKSYILGGDDGRSGTETGT